MLMLKSPKASLVNMVNFVYLLYVSMYVCMYVSFGVTTSVLLIFITAITCDGIVIRTGWWLLFILTLSVIQT